jgi:hypothetical protein
MFPWTLKVFTSRLLGPLVDSDIDLSSRNANTTVFINSRLQKHAVVSSKVQVQFHTAWYPKPQVPLLPEDKTTRKILGLKSRPSQADACLPGPAC